MNVHLYTICWNELDMLRFFFRHYDGIVDRYVIYDDGSDDGSLEALQAHPKVEVRSFPRVDQDSFVLSHQVLQNDVWKESRGKADWVIITAIVEHLTTKDGDLRGYLEACKADGVTLVPAIGYHMYSTDFPGAGEHLSKTRVIGRPHPFYNKLSIFNPDAIAESRFDPGRHRADPSGRLRYPTKDEVMLLHYKNLGFERTFARRQALGQRLGKVDNEKQFGADYHVSRETFAERWAAGVAVAMDISTPDFDCSLAAAPPLWWRETSDERSQKADKASASLIADLRAKLRLRESLRKVKRWFA